MRYLDIKNWNRKPHFEHFMRLEDPYFGITASVDVSKAYQYSRDTDKSFFVLYLHACLKALNAIENFKFRLEGDKIAIYDVIHASATIARTNHTFGFSFIHFDEDIEIFNQNFLKEKKRIQNSTALYAPINTQDCMYCSALPWVSFTGHKEPKSGIKNESIPKLAFGKVFKENETLKMPVAINVNHALVDGYHVGLFFEEFQKHLDKNS